MILAESFVFTDVIILLDVEELFSSINGKTVSAMLYLIFVVKLRDNEV